MNSFEILKRLNRLVNDREIPIKARETIRSAIQHIEINDREIFKLREDITNVEFDDED